MKFQNIIAVVFSCLLSLSCSAQMENQIKPNFIIIYCDDLGYGDLGCFGATDIKTPNIDRLADEGIKFTEFYSASAVCSPSRAALLTGRYPQRMGINSVFFAESYTGMPVEEITIADELKAAGYATGHVGKWHLGHREKFLPLQRGFDEYFGIPYSNDMESVVYLRGNEVEEFHVDQRYITKTYTEEALDFINDHSDENFFLYLAHSMPHTPIYASEDFLGSSERGLYGDVIQEIDWSVGEIIRKLEEEDILENTLIVFSSDNGPWLVMEDHGGSAGILREGKQYTFEGGMRVPTVAMWKGNIKGGTVYDDMALMMDWFPTLLNLAGIDQSAQNIIDGVDISDVLLNDGDREGNGFLYFDGSNLQGYRQGDWKVKLAYKGFEGAAFKKGVPPHDTLLINLKKDPSESRNLAKDMPEKLAEMLQKMESSRNELGELPPTLVFKTNGDYSNYDYLKEKHGEGVEYWRVDYKK